jgi:hypothetical protein
MLLSGQGRHKEQHMARVPTQPKEAEIYTAISSGSFKVKGRMYSYFRGKTYPANFPLIRIRPDAFQPLRFAGMTEPTAEGGNTA